MQPSDSLPPVGRGSGRPWPVAYPVPRATRRKKGLPGAWAVLFQRAVGSDPAGCASRLAHRVETAIAFRLHNALGTQNERYFVAVTPTAHSLACLRIGVFVTADAARLATGVGGSPFTGRVSHPLDGEQSFMTSPHRHSPLTSLAWSHRAPTPRSHQANTPVIPQCLLGDDKWFCLHPHLLLESPVGYGQDRQTSPLRSIAITATSSRLRATPSQCLASVLRFLWGRHLNGSLRIETTGSRSSIEKPGPGSRHLHAGHRLGSLQGNPQTSPDGITLHRFRCHVLVHDESTVVHLRSSF